MYWIIIENLQFSTYSCDPFILMAFAKFAHILKNCDGLFFHFEPRLVTSALLERLSIP